MILADLYLIVLSFILSYAEMGVSGLMNHASHYQANILRRKLPTVAPSTLILKAFHKVLSFLTCKELWFLPKAKLDFHARAKVFFFRTISHFKLEQGCLHSHMYLPVILPFIYVFGFLLGIRNETFLGEF